MTVVSVTPRPPSGVSVSRSGPAGKNAYQIAVDAGFVGTVEEWLASLVGETGDIGPIPNHEWDGTQLRFQQIDGSWGVFVDLRGPAPEHSWSGTQLRFKQPGGTWGSYVDLKGADGKSAYQVAVDNGFAGDQAAWLASLEGADGADGSDGAAATITVGTVSTVAAGQPATVTNVGTSSAAVFDFEIPRGADGDGSGDMLAATYDPNGKASDAFDMDNMVEGTTTKIMTGAERSKLSGIASGATANDTDANLKNRANHTGTQAAATITGLATVATSGAYADLSGKPTLGTAAALNVGTSSSTVAAGDDSRITGALQSGTEDQTITGGARVTVKDLGNLSGTTKTIDPGDRPIQKITNNGAGTIAPGSNYGAITLIIVNGSGAGAITTSGFTKTAGDSFTTTNGHKFVCSYVNTADGSLLTVVALQ